MVIFPSGSPEESEADLHTMGQQWEGLGGDLGKENKKSKPSFDHTGPLKIKANRKLIVVSLFLMIAVQRIVALQVVKNK